MIRVPSAVRRVNVLRWVDGPVIVHASVRKQCRIQCVVRVVVGKHDVGDTGRINGENLKSLEDLAPVMHHAGVDDYRRRTVLYEADCGLDSSRRWFNRPNDKSIDDDRHRLRRVVALGFHLDVHPVVKPSRLLLH